MATCEHCEARFANAMQLGAHTRYCRMEQLRRQQPDDDDMEDAVVTMSVQSALPPIPITLHSLTRRQQSPWGRVQPVLSTPRRRPVENNYVRDYREVEFIVCLRSIFLCSAHICPPSDLLIVCLYTAGAVHVGCAR